MFYKARKYRSEQANIEWNITQLCKGRKIKQNIITDQSNKKTIRKKKTKRKTIIYKEMTLQKKMKAEEYIWI